MLCRNKRHTIEIARGGNDQTPEIVVMKKTRGYFLQF